MFLPLDTQETFSRNETKHYKCFNIDKMRYLNILKSKSPVPKNGSVVAYAYEMSVVSQSVRVQSLFCSVQTIVVLYFVSVRWCSFNEVNLFYVHCSEMFKVSDSEEKVIYQPGNNLVGF